MALQYNETDPFATKRSLSGTGQPAGLRNISFGVAGERPPIYVTPEGYASTDPKVGEYNKAAMRAASPPAGTPPPVTPGTAATPAAPSGANKVFSGLRGFGGNLMKAVTPAILTKTAIDTATTPTEEADTRMGALGLSTSGQVAAKVNSPLAAQLRYGAIPFIGPAMVAAANLDPQLAGDLETRAKQAALSLVGANGIADRRANQIDIGTPFVPPTSPAPGQPPVNQTLRGSSVMPGYTSEGTKVPDSGAELSAEIAKIGRNPFKGIRSRDFYQGGQQELANNVASELNQRAKVKALQAKYATDEKASASAASAKLQAAQMGQTQAENNQKSLKDMFDRTATIPTYDKDGKQTGSTVDPAMRNRAEDFARNAVAGWDQLSPEQRSQGFEQVRHKFMLQELMNSGEQNLLGKFMSGVGLADDLGGYTAKPLAVKAIRTIGAGDLGQKSARLTSIVSGRPYVEFENGKLYPLADVMNTPELKSAFEGRIAQSPKSVKDQYKKYAQKGQ